MKDLSNDFASEKWRTSILFVSAILMLAGLLCSRALLSSALIAFALASLFHKHILGQLAVFFSSPLLWSMTLLFFLPLISGLWSHDLSQWGRILRIKLPLVVLPVCFAATGRMKNIDWRKIAIAFVLLVLVGVCWSLWRYFQSASVINIDYLRAHVMQTPLNNDHVRFSLMVVLAMLTIAFLLTRNARPFEKTGIIVLAVIGLVFIVYLHILAARTGLICLYGGLAILVARLASKKKTRKYTAIAGIILLLPVIFYFALPTFKNRLSYLKYDLSFVQRNSYLPGSSDGNRIASLKAGWQLLKTNPWTGVGFGDLKRRADDFYDVNYRPMGETDKILPSSEWMIYGAGGGWPGFAAFSFAMLVPFFVTGLKKNISWWVLNIFIASSYLFDIGLEVQYGVFIHAFVLLWWYTWLRPEQ